MTSTMNPTAVRAQISAIITEDFAAEVTEKIDGTVQGPTPTDLRWAAEDLANEMYRESMAATGNDFASALVHQAVMTVADRMIGRRFR